MKPQQRSRRLQTVAAGVSLTLIFSSLGIGGRAEQARQDQSVPSKGLSNGTYLYGEAPQPDQVGKGYVMFAHRNGEVTGAFYYPLSEFDCFTGAMKNNTLEVKSVGLGDSEPVMVKVKLSTLHLIPTVSANDRRILSSCEEAMAGQSNQRLPVSIER